MATSTPVTEVKVEDYVFPPTVKAPGSDKSFFLGGAGVRGLEIQGNFVKFTAIGVYLEETAISALASKWKGKTSTELVESVEFFRDIVTEKVTENCVAFWKAIGIYTDDEAKAVEKFLETFKDEKFPPGHSILFTQSPHGSLTIGFSKHDSIPTVGSAVIENKNLSEAVLESIIGKHGVSPEAKQCIAARVSGLLNPENAEANSTNGVESEKSAKVDTEKLSGQEDIKS
ncbi:chalcone--flavonone isomerase-like isoform X2 [Chenopodium quinoa]|uniref:chalcone--flavonone isomerase-like isoform X2 n=1 Tax=Chenopodium quinoa TaxID=63459 RepID=UPI000B78306C|nr:chalcone--flavonone isomerase-like isoform X2 [Chenopodium quinoa]